MSDCSNEFETSRRGRLIGCFFLALIVVLWCAFAFASTVILPTEDDMIDASDVVAVAKVTSITSYDTDVGIRTLVDFAVSEVLKGTPPPGLAVRELGGKVGENVFWIPGSPTYRVGERVMVFLDQREDGTYRTKLLDAGRVPVLPDGVARSMSGDTLDTFKSRLTSRVLQRKQELQSRSARAASATFMVQPAPLSGPAESQAEFRFMTDPPSLWLNRPVMVYGDPAGDAKIGPVESRRAVADAAASWSSEANVIFAYAGDTPAVGYACVPDKLLVQFRDVKNDIEDPSNCSGVLAIGGFCTSGLVSGKYRIASGAVVFNNGWEGCSFWSADNIAEVMTHEFGHAVGLAHSAESGQTSTPHLADATMYWTAHFDGRRTGLRAYDKGAIQSLYGSVRASPVPTPVPTRTPVPTATVVPTATPTPIPTPVPTATTTPGPTGSPAGRFLEVRQLLIKGSARRGRSGTLTFKLVTTEKLPKDRPTVLFASELGGSVLSNQNIQNVQTYGETLTFRAVNVPSIFYRTSIRVVVIVGQRVAFETLTCTARDLLLGTTIYCSLIKD